MDCQQESEESIVTIETASKHTSIYLLKCANIHTVCRPQCMITIMLESMLYLLALPLPSTVGMENMPLHYNVVVFQLLLPLVAHMK